MAVKQSFKITAVTLILQLTRSTKNSYLVNLSPISPTLFPYRSVLIKTKRRRKRKKTLNCFEHAFGLNFILKRPIVFTLIATHFTQ